MKWNEKYIIIESCVKKENPQKYPLLKKTQKTWKIPLFK